MQPEIFELHPTDAVALSQLLCAARPDYIAHFHPFPFGKADIEARLGHRDCYWGLRSGGTLAGFFMLRGFDEGYRRPSFGVFVAESFTGRGFARAALAHALNWCAENGIALVMLKVHPDNTRARRAYNEAGFESLGICPQTGHEICEKRIL